MSYIVQFENKNKKTTFQSQTPPVVVNSQKISHVWVDGGTKCIESPKEGYKGYKSAMDYSRDTSRG